MTWANTLRPTGYIVTNHDHRCPPIRTHSANQRWPRHIVPVNIPAPNPVPPVVIVAPFEIDSTHWQSEKPWLSKLTIRIYLVSESQFPPITIFSELNLFSAEHLSLKCEKFIRIEIWSSSSNRSRVWSMISNVSCHVSCQLQLSSATDANWQ